MLTIVAKRLRKWDNGVVLNVTTCLDNGPSNYCVGSCRVVDTNYTDVMLKQNLFCTEVVGYILYITFGMRAQRGLWYFSFCQLVCLSQLYLNGRASTCSTNDAIHPASNQSGIACGIFSEMSPLQRSGVAIFTSDMKYIPNTGFTSVSFVASAYNTNIWVRVAGSKDANWLHILH